MCENCAIGLYNEHDHQTSCKICKTGSYIDTVGSIHCKSCPAGKWIDDAGVTVVEHNALSACKSCGLGKIIAPHAGGTHGEYSKISAGNPDDNPRFSILTTSLSCQSAGRKLGYTSFGPDVALTSRPAGCFVESGVVQLNTDVTTRRAVGFPLLEAVASSLSTNCMSGVATSCTAPGLQIGDRCEGDGEAGTSEGLNNCRNYGDQRASFDIYRVTGLPYQDCSTHTCLVKSNNNELHQSDDCVNCVRGRYADQVAQGVCKECDAGLFNASKSRRTVRCLYSSGVQLYYGREECFLFFLQEFLIRLHFFFLLCFFL